MTEKEVEDVLNELYEVRPEMLDDKAKRLFEAIMKIADEKDELKEKNKKLIDGQIETIEKILAPKLLEKFISKDKIKEKIEELGKKEKEELKGTKGQDRYNIKQEFMFKKNILQELLEERN